MKHEVRFWEAFAYAVLVLSVWGLVLWSASRRKNEGSKRMDKFEVFARDSGWYFHRKSANGEIVAQSECYTTKQAARDEAVRQAAAPAEVVVLDK